MEKFVWSGDGNYYFDLRGTGETALAAIDKNNDKIIDYFLLDRNNNGKPDTFIDIYSNGTGGISYQWLFDNNEDDHWDAYGDDIDADWILDSITKI